MTGKIAEIYIQLGARIDKFEKGMTDAQKAMTKVGKKMEQVGKNLTMKVTLPLLALGAASIKAFADFDKAMTESMAIMGDLTEATQAQMSSLAKIISSETTFAAKELAEAYFFLASAGMDAEQSMGALRSVAQFAQAGAFDLATATDLLTDAQTALGLSSKDVEENQRNLIRVSDVLVGANTLANASVQQFAEALTNRAAAALTNVNKGLEEGVAILAAYADKGIKGQIAGTRLAMMFNGIFAAVSKQGPVWDELNIKVWDAAGNMRNVGLIIQDMEVAFKDMTPEMKQAALEMLGFNIKTKSSILTLLGSSEKIINWTADLKNMGGITKEVSEKQLKAFSNQMTLVKNAMINAAASMGEVLAPAIGFLAKGLKALMGIFESSSKPMKTVIAIIAGIAAAAGPLIFMLGKLTTTFATTGAMGIGLSTALGVLKGALAAILSPVGLIVAALGILTLGIIKTIKEFKMMKELPGVLAEFDKAAGRSVGFLAKFFEGTRALSDEFTLLSRIIKKDFEGNVNAALEALANGAIRGTKRLEELRIKLFGMLVVEKDLADEREKNAKNDAKFAALQDQLTARATTREEKYTEAVKAAAIARDALTGADTKRRKELLLLSGEVEAANKLSVEAATSDTKRQLALIGINIALEDTFDLTHEQIQALEEQKEKLEGVIFASRSLNPVIFDTAGKVKLLTIEATKAQEEFGKLAEKFDLLKDGADDFSTALDEANVDFFRDFKIDKTDFEIPFDTESMDDVIAGFLQFRIDSSKVMQEHEADMKKKGKRIKIDWKNVADDMGNVWAEGFASMMNDTTTFADFISSTFDGVAAGVSLILGDVFTELIGITGDLAGPIGAIFSGIIAGALGLFKKLLNIKSKAEKEAEAAAVEAAQAEQQFADQIEESKNVMSAYGEITDATAKKMAELRKTQEGYVVESLVFADVIKDVGVNQENLNLLWDGAIKVLSLMNDGQISLVEGSAILDDAFSQLVAGAKKFGVEGSDAMVNFILKTREAGIEVASVTSYINDQLGVVKSGSMSAAEGLKAMADNIPVEKVAELFKEQKRLIEEMEKVEVGTEEYEKLGLELAKVELELQDTAVTAHEMANDLESQALRVFNAMIANGASYNEAMASLGPTLDIINQAHKDLGVEGGIAIKELLHIRDVVEENKSLFNAIDGNVAVLTALRNTANLSEEALLDSAKQASKFYDKIVAAGLTGDQALAQMAPTLQILADEAEKYGYKLDDNTQALIDQAKEMGLVTEVQEDEQDQQERLFGELGDKMGEIMERLADKIGGFFKRAFGDAFDEVEGDARDTRRNVEHEWSGFRINIPVDYEATGDVPSGNDSGSGGGGGGGGSRGRDFAGGGAFIPTTPTPIMVHPKELVDITPLDELSSGRSRAGLSLDGGGSGGGTSISVQINAVDAQSFRDLMENDGVEIIIDKLREGGSLPRGIFEEIEEFRQ